MAVIFHIKCSGESSMKKKSNGRVQENNEKVIRLPSE